MNSTEIIKRARSLADLTNSNFITWDDEVSSLWESWKDIYSKITDSSDDYFISSIILNTNTAIKLGDSEYELTIPDIYKIRFVNYWDNGRWVSMDKFNTNQRNRSLSSPRYRWRGSKLWIVSSSFGLPSQIRIDYYPSPVKPSVPEMSYNYCSTYTLAQKVDISSPSFTRTTVNTMTEPVDYMFYIYNNDIYVESTVLQSKTALWTTGTNISNLIYDLGYLYWLDGTSLYRSVTDMASTLTPVLLTTGITNFTIGTNKITYSTATETYEMNKNGTGSTLLYAYPISNRYVNYYTISNILYKDGVSTGLSAIKLWYDGTNLYRLDSANVLYKEDEILQLSVTKIGTGSDNFIPIITDKLAVQALSTLDNTKFDYPVNEANEIMAYQSAIDYKRKQNGDTTALIGRLQEIWDRFMDVLKRDEGQPERRISEAPKYFY